MTREMAWVYLTEKEKAALDEYAQENGLSFSATVRSLALLQLQYQKWEAAGKPRRKKVEKQVKEEVEDQDDIVWIKVD